MGMEPFQMKYPTNLEPSFILRSRREMNTVDATNTRLVNYWYNDVPERRERDVKASDMNPTPSRLYREDLNRSQPFVITSVEDAKDVTKIQSDISDTMKKIAWLQTQEKTEDVKLQLKEQRILFNSLTTMLRDANTSALGSNPYFEKYDIASDSRNVIRELRGAVSEDVVDRGIAESQKLFERITENRWYEPDKSTDSANAFELLRPRFNNMENNYWQ